MNQKTYVILILLLLVSVGRSQAPVLTIEQAETVLQFYLNDHFPDYPPAGIRIYPNDRHYALRLDIRLETTVDISLIIDLFDAIDNVCQYARDTISVYTVITHKPDQITPTIFEAEASCTAALFRYKNLSRRNWLGTCLIRRESLAPYSLTPTNQP
ncbi:MAG: hypothetical protein ACE5D8_04825 [Fidelibacterota bacterium]